MRFIAFLILLGVSLNISAQNNFPAQIRAIVKDTAYGFKNVRGEFKKETHVYLPKFIIDSTYDGMVYNVDTRSYYVFRVSNSQFEDSTMTSKILISWKNKIAAALGSSFSVAPEDAPFGIKKFFDKGYVFTHRKLSIAVEQINDVVDKKKVHYVRIFIMYKPGI